MRAASSSPREASLEPGEVPGLASRKAATAALTAAVAVVKGTPLRRALSEALEQGGNLGGKERRFVAFATRELSRHLRRLELSARAHGWPSSKLQLPEDQVILRYALWRRELTQAPVEKILAEVGLPGPIRPRGLPDTVLREVLAREVELPWGEDPQEQAANRHSFPSWLVRRLGEVVPEGELEPLLAALNREPRLTLRARPSGSRAALLEVLIAQGLKVAPCAEVPDALHVTDEGRAIFESRFMKEGRLQVMDLGSQLLAGLCRAQPGQVVVDYCAGAGGKTLALADAVGPTGRVYAWDSKPQRLAEARRRAGELRLRHVTFPKEPRLDLAQLVLIDAPCSGTGTLAREPDQKWKLTPQKVAEHQRVQLEILTSVAGRVAPGTVLVYGTCSLLAEEDEQVVQAFLAAHPAFHLEGTLRTWPHRLEGGGFFGARLVRS
jgi:16S rRNA (cytosine967-C5)-methyltransferase